MKTTSRSQRFWLRIGALASKETLHIIRDPRTIYLALIMPVFLLLLFGFGVSFDLEAIPFAVVDQDKSLASRTFLQEFGASQELASVGDPSNAEEAEAWFREGRALAAVIVPQGFEKDLSRGDATTIQLLVDAADGNTATQTLAKAEAITGAAAAAMLAPAGVAIEPPVEARVFTLFNPESKSAYYLVPGLSAYVTAMVAVLLTALTVAREWEQGSMEQLFATPVGRLEIVIGKLLPYLALGLIAVMLVLAVGMWVFGVPFRGDPFTLALASILFVIGMLGQGLLVSVLTRNQLVATQAATMSAMLPSMLLSGFIFPIASMPVILQGISFAIPARYFIETLRGVLLRGNGMAELWDQIVALAIFAIVTLALSTARFRRVLA